MIFRCLNTILLSFLLPLTLMIFSFFRQVRALDRIGGCSLCLLPVHGTALGPTDLLVRPHGPGISQGHSKHEKVHGTAAAAQKRLNLMIIE